MPTQLEDLAQQVRLLRSDLLTATSGGGGGGSGQTIIEQGVVLAQFNRSGVVRAGPFNRVWPVTTDTTIAGISLTLGTKPWADYLTVDVFVNGTTLWPVPANRPLFTDTSDNPLIVLFDPQPTVNAEDLITATVVRPAGRDLELHVVAAADTTGVPPQTPSPTVARYDLDDYDDPLALYGG